jgi:hypothetical protein
MALLEGQCINTCPRHFGDPEQASLADRKNKTHFCFYTNGKVGLLEIAGQIVCLNPACKDHTIEYLGEISSS